MATAGDIGRFRARSLTAALLGIAALGCFHRASAEPWRITPALEVRETLTDNVRLEPAETRRSDLVSEVTPSLRVDGSTDRVQGHLDYRLHGLYYARSSSSNDLQNELNAFATVQAVKNFFFIDLRGAITQELASPFGPRPAGPESITGNRAETRSFQVSPYLRGTIGATANYQLRYDFNEARSSAQSSNVTRTTSIDGRIDSGAAFAKIKWALQGNHEVTSFDQGRDGKQDVVRGSLTYEFNPDLFVSGNVGRESSNFASFDQESRTLYGTGVTWSPGNRTDLQARWEHRFFGSGWNYSLRYRTPRASFSLRDSRDVTSDAQQLLRGGGGVGYDLLFNALASRIPDPVQRAIETQRLLQQGGIPADLGLPIGLFTSGIFVQRRQELSAILLGQRNTVGITLFRTERRPLGISADNATDATAVIATRDQGASLVASHTMSGKASLSGNVSYTRTESLGVTEGESRQWTMRLLYSLQFTPRLSGSLELRHVQSTSTGEATAGYRENAATAAMLMQF